MTPDEAKKWADVMPMLQTWHAGCQAAIAKMDELEQITGEGGSLREAVDSVISDYSSLVSRSVGMPDDFLDEMVWSGGSMTFTWSEACGHRQTYSINSILELTAFIAGHQEEPCQ